MNLFSFHVVSSLRFYVFILLLWKHMARRYTGAAKSKLFSIIITFISVLSSI